MPGRKLPIFLLSIILLSGVFLGVRKAHADFGITDGSLQYLYHLDNTSDSSGYGYNLTQSGGAFVMGMFGDAYNVSGTNDNLTFSGPASTTLPLAHGVSFWIKMDVDNDAQYISDFSTSEIHQCSIQIYSSGEHSHVITLYNDGGSVVYGSSTIATGQWYNVVINTDSSDNASLYIDGSLDATGSLGSGNANCGTAITLGNFPGGSNPLDGTLDDYVVLNREFTSDEIAGIWDGGAGQQVDGVSISPEGLPDGALYTPYAQTITANGAFSGALSWSVASGTLPAGLSLDTGSTASSTTISGTPTAIGNYDFTVSFTYGASVVDREYSVYINPAPTSTPYYINDGSVQYLYHLEDTSDSSGNGRTMTQDGGTSTIGFFGDGYYPSGSSDGLSFASTTTDLPLAHGVSFWIKMNDINDSQYISNFSTSEIHQCSIQIYSSGEHSHVITLYNDGGSPLNGSTTIVAGQWYNVVVDTDASNTSYIYVDGSLDATGIVGEGYSDCGNSLVLGNFPGGSNPLDGILDDYVVRNVEFTPTDISDIWNDGWSKEVCVLGQACPNVSSTEIGPENFYAQIENASVRNLHENSTTSSTVLKTLPGDWIIQVVSTTDSSDDPIVDGSGNTWFKVVDPTDNVTGWMVASDTMTQYISSYDGSAQAGLEASSTAITVGTSTGETGEYVLEAIDHYYNDSSTVNSLYSSDDDTGINAATTTPPGGSSPNDLSMFATSSYPDISSSSFPEKVIWGIAADEDGGTGFDNTTVTYDYGHGIMQLTPNILAHEFEDEDYSTNDPRGYGSGVTIPPCASYMTSTYINCYANAGTYNTYDKYYIPYGNNSSSPMYEQYANTVQSIYANVKDGMKVLTDKLDNNRSCNVTTTPFTVYSSEYGTTTYSCADMETVLTTAAYNGSSPSTYLPAVADRLENIGTYFPGQTSSDITDIIDKIALAGASSSVYAQLYSPGDLSVQDSEGHTIGVVNGVVENDFPFASYDPQTKSIRIFFPQDNNFTFKVSGTGTGVYRLKIGISDGSSLISFATGDMPTIPHQLDTYTLDRGALLEGKNGVMLNVENKGDGTINKTMTYGAAISAVVPAPFDPRPATPVPLQTKFSFPIPIQPSKPRLIVPQAVPILQTPTSTRLNINTSTFINTSSTMDIDTSTQINSSTQN